MKNMNFLIVDRKGKGNNLVIYKFKKDKIILKNEKKYPRDLVGYGSKQVKVRWPGNAKLALQFVLNYEEGAENCTLHGDKTSEVFLSEIIGAKAIKGRHLNMESIYEYGSRREGFGEFMISLIKRKFHLLFLELAWH